MMYYTDVLLDEIIALLDEDEEISDDSIFEVGNINWSQEGF